MNISVDKLIVKMSMTFIDITYNSLRFGSLRL